MTIFIYILFLHHRKVNFAYFSQHKLKLQHMQYLVTGRCVITKQGDSLRTIYSVNDQLLQFNCLFIITLTYLCIRIPTLTHKMIHHGRIMMRRRSQAQQLLATRHCGVVDGLDVDVVSFQQGVTHLVVQLSIAHLEIGPMKGDI